VKHKKYHSDTAFLDLFLNALLGFVFLFIVSWLLINPVAKNKVTDAKGEFIITISWDDDNADDIDTWCKDPAGNVVSFRQKEIGVMHLDRDDMGLVNDKIVLATGDILEVKTNREVLTIRGIHPGEYVVNLHLYNKRSKTETNVKVDVLKLNPFYTIATKTVTLYKQGQELTVIRFTVDANGDVSDINDIPTMIANAIDTYSTGGAHTP
jgi:hypothetical protein